MTDLQLLAEFARTRSSEAFVEIVRRHVDLVYGTARRLVEDEHLAQDVAQAAFIVLAKKAKGVDGRRLAGWLVNTTRLAAKDARRAKLCREKHEGRAAQMRSSMAPAADEPTLEELTPLLDEALARLNETDRTAVVTRFLQGKSFAEVGAAMGSSEEAARKRVERAVEKLRTVLMKRGVAPSVGGLMVLLAANQAQAAPAGLANSISAGAVSGGVGTSAILAKGVMKMMAWGTVKVAVLASAAVVLIGAVVIVMAGPAGTQPVAPQEPAAKEGLSQTVDPEVRQLVARIRESEALYDNIEFSYRAENSNGTAGSVTRQPGPVASRVTEVQAIYQGPRQWVSLTETNTMPGGEVDSNKNVTGFDGTVMQVCHVSANKTTANISDLQPQANPWHPFRLINLNGRTRLSATLEGEMAQVYRKAGLTGTSHVTRLKDGQCLGLSCIVLEERQELDYAAGLAGPEHTLTRHLLWVCPDRNYLPLRHEGYETKDGHEDLTYVREAKELTPLSPGLYFPTRITGRWRGLSGKELSQQEAGTFQNVHINPSYAASRFADVPIPDGVDLLVYKDGKQISATTVTSAQSVVDARRAAGKSR